MYTPPNILSKHVFFTNLLQCIVRKKPLLTLIEPNPQCVFSSKSEYTKVTSMSWFDSVTITQVQLRNNELLSLGNDLKPNTPVVFRRTSPH